MKLRRMRKRNLSSLRRHRRPYLLHPMPDIDHSSLSGRVKIPPTIGGINPALLATDGVRKFLLEITRKERRDFGHSRGQSLPDRWRGRLRAASACDTLAGNFLEHS